MNSAREAARQAAQQAARHWGLSGLAPVAARENETFAARTHDGRRVAFRRHRPGYRTRGEIVSELCWMRALAREGLPVPTPLESLSGSLTTEAGGVIYSAVSWVPGTPMGATGTPLSLADRPGTFRHLGGLMARLHHSADHWTPPPDFTRPDWCAEGLLGDDPLWGRFWEHPDLSGADRCLLSAARAGAAEDLERLSPETGLIHADAVRENVLVAGQDLWLIDFDDIARGYRLFDVVTALARNEDEPDYPALKAAFIEGYRAVRPLDISGWALMRLLRSLTYVGWIMDRLQEPGAALRSERFINDARRQAQTFLAHRKALT